MFGRLYEIHEIGCIQLVRFVNVREILHRNVIGSCNSRSHGPVESEDFFQSHKQSWYTKGAHRKGSTVRAAASLMSLNFFSNLIGPCDPLFPRKISQR